MTGQPEDEPDFMDLIEAGDSPRSPEEAQARAPYERLIERIREQRDISPPAGWKERGIARWAAVRRRRRIGKIAGAAAAATVAILLLQLCGRSSGAGLELAVRAPSGSVHRGDAAVGDALHVRARADQAHFELRVYLGVSLVARCPGSPGCRVEGSVTELDWPLAAPGSYQIVTLSSASAIPDGDRTIDRDLLDARSAGATLESRRVSVSP